MGNPRYYMDPERMAQVAKALPARLGATDSAQAADFTAGAEALATAVTEHIPRGNRMAARAQVRVRLEQTPVRLPLRLAMGPARAVGRG